MDAVLRILTPADAGLFAHVDEDVFDRAIDPVLLAEFLAEPTHHICAALGEGKIVGFASAVRYVHPDWPAELFINQVGVATTHHRRGIGKAILSALLDHARSLGCCRAWVLTNDDNTAARAPT